MRLATIASNDLPTVAPSADRRSALQTDHDLEAIGIWLQTRGSRSAHTARAYRKEAERFVLFIHLELGLERLAQLKVEHVQAYLDHLADPPEHWLIPTHLPKHERLMSQCLQGALSASSISYARTVIKSLFRYLQDAGHVHNNPIALTAQPIVNPTPMADRALEPAAWLFLWTWLVEQSEQAQGLLATRQAMRQRWLCALLYHTGLRRSSIAEGRMSGFIRREGRWQLTVPSKGGRSHTVILHQQLLAELQHYRQSLGLSPLPYPHDSQPLVSDLRQPDQPILARQIGYDLEQIRKQAAAVCPDPYLAMQIAALTPHGLRHTYATHSLIAGAPLDVIQHALGHRQISTTSLYAKTTTQMREQHADRMQQFWQHLQNHHTPR